MPNASCMPLHGKSLQLCQHSSAGLQRCLGCGTTTTPLWRPAVLAGPKVLCNACGVRALYSSRHRLQNIEKAKARQPNGSKAAPAGHKQASQKHAWQSNKRRRMSAQFDDVVLTSAQAQTIKVKRHYGTSKQQIVRWNVTDSSINDTRDFDQAMHAQAFIDECWLFVLAGRYQSKLCFVT